MKWIHHRWTRIDTIDWVSLDPTTKNRTHSFCSLLPLIAKDDMSACIPSTAVPLSGYLSFPLPNVTGLDKSCTKPSLQTYTEETVVSVPVTTNYIMITK